MKKLRQMKKKYNKCLKKLNIFKPTKIVEDISKLGVARSINNKNNIIRS